MRAIVIGSGIGGLIAAIRLAAAGHETVVLEKNPVLGGKVAELDEAGYRFDLGPTSLTMPQLFDEVFRLAGSSLEAELETVRLDPQLRCRWPDDSALDIPDDPDVTELAVEQFSPGSGSHWRAFAAHAERSWQAYDRRLAAGSAGSTRTLGQRLGGNRKLAPIDGKRTLAKATASFFDDPRLQQLVNRVAQHMGSSPYRVPATAMWWQHVEQVYGCWHVVGGIARLRDALERAATATGVEIRAGADVGRISTANGAVAGVELADGGDERADVVVSNADATHLYTRLLPDTGRATQLDRAGLSASAFVLCVAVRGRTDAVAHHNVFFPLHDRQEYRYLESGQMPLDQTVHATVSSVTDRTVAPSDGENWRITVQTPPAIGIDRKLMSAAVLNRLAERGFDLRNRIEFTRSVLPADLDARYRAPGGAIHGTSSNGRQAAFDRPSNVGPLHGLYLVGGSAHPGGGLPMVATGARLVAELVADRHG